MGQLSRVNQLAIALLLMGAARNYGWLLADPQVMGVASKAIGAIAAICFLLIIWMNFPRNLLLTLVIAWYAFEELQTAMCSVMYLIKPWPVEAGQSMCSARIGFDVGAVGVFVVGLLAFKLVHSNGPE